MACWYVSGSLYTNKLAPLSSLDSLLQLRTSPGCRLAVRLYSHTAQCMEFICSHVVLITWHDVLIEFAQLLCTWSSFEVETKEDAHLLLVCLPASDSWFAVLNNKQSLTKQRNVCLTNDSVLLLHMVILQTTFSIVISCCYFHEFI